MTILVQYESLITDMDRPFDVNFNITVNVVSKIDDPAILIPMAITWDTLPTDLFNEFIVDILEAKMQWSTARLRGHAANDFMVQNSDGRFYFIQSNTIFDSDQPSTVFLTLEIGDTRNPEVIDHYI